MQTSNKVYALTQDFMNELYNDWIENYSDTCISDFLDDISKKYKALSDKHLAKGDTGIFFDSAIISKINNGFDSVNKDHMLYDLESSKLIFGNSPSKRGLFRLNEKGEKIPLNYVNATDPRIWNYLSLFVLNSYTKNRWGASKDSKRIFMTRVSNERISRHSVSRLFWSAQLCENNSMPNNLSLLDILWTSEDFMTQVTERSTASNRKQLQWFLELCGDNQFKKIVFTKNKASGQFHYRSLLKLFIADELVSDIGMMDREQFEELFRVNLDTCLMNI